MALFESNESKEERKEKQLRAIMAQYGLQNLPSEYRSMVKEINTDLIGSGLMSAGAKLSGIKKYDEIAADYLNILIKQNWIIIRQLDDIAALLEK